MKDTNRLLTDVLKIAVSRERQAFEFYTAMTNRMEDPQTVSLFKKLAFDELNHKDNLELEIMKSGNVFVDTKEHMEELGIEDIEEAIPANISLEEAFRVAISKERAAFRFYVAMAELMQEPLAKDMCLELAETEAGHKTLLELEYQRIFD